MNGVHMITKTEDFRIQATVPLKTLRDSLRILEHIEQTPPVTWKKTNSLRLFLTRGIEKSSSTPDVHQQIQDYIRQLTLVQTKLQEAHCAMSEPLLVSQSPEKVYEAIDSTERLLVAIHQQIIIYQKTAQHYNYIDRTSQQTADSTTNAKKSILEFNKQSNDLKYLCGRFSLLLENVIKTLEDLQIQQGALPPGPSHSQDLPGQVRFPHHLTSTSGPARPVQPPPRRPSLAHPGGYS